MVVSHLRSAFKGRHTTIGECMPRARRCLFVPVILFPCMFTSSAAVTMLYVSLRAWMRATRSVSLPLILMRSGCFVFYWVMIRLPSMTSCSVIRSASAGRWPVSVNAGQNPLENGGVGLTFYDSVHLPDRGRWEAASPSGGPRQCGVWGGAPGSQKHAFTPAKKGGFWPSLTVR